MKFLITVLVFYTLVNSTSIANTSQDDNIVFGNALPGKEREVCTSTTNLSTKEVLNLPQKQFVSIQDKTFLVKKTYCLKPELVNQNNEIQNFIISLNNALTNIESFQIQSDTIIKKSITGSFISYYHRAYRCLRKKISPVDLTKEEKFSIFIKVRNKADYDYRLNYVSGKPN